MLFVPIPAKPPNPAKTPKSPDALDIFFASFIKTEDCILKTGVVKSM